MGRRRGGGSRNRSGNRKQSSCCCCCCCCFKGLCKLFSRSPSKPRPQKAKKTNWGRNRNNTSQQKKKSTLRQGKKNAPRQALNSHQPNRKRWFGNKDKGKKRKGQEKKETWNRAQPKARSGGVQGFTNLFRRHAGPTRSPRPIARTPYQYRSTGSNFISRLLIRFRGRKDDKSKEDRECSKPSMGGSPAKYMANQGQNPRLNSPAEDLACSSREPGHQFQVNADVENICHNCTKTFSEPMHLDQHKQDTGHKIAPKNAAKNYIDKFMSERKVHVDPNDKKAYVETFKNVMEPVLKHVSEQEGGKVFSSNYRMAGSHAAKSKIRKADEFDTNIPMNVEVTCIKTKGSLPYIYEDKIQPPKDGHSASNLNVPRVLKDEPSGKIEKGRAMVRVNPDTVPEHLLHRGDNLIPHKVQEDLYRKVDTALKDLNMKGRITEEKLCYTIK